MRTIFGLGALAAAGLTAAQPAFAINTIWGGGGSNDSVSWGQLGATETVVPSGTTATSANGLVVTLTDSVGSMERRDQGNGWDGSFAPGEQLLWNEGDGTITITFSTAVSAAGAEIQSDQFGDFIARITLNDGSFFTIGGTSAPTGADTNPFLGTISDSANIASISFSMPTNGPSFAIGRLLLIDGPSVPEPASWALMLLGFGTIGLAIRGGRRKALEAIA